MNSPALTSIADDHDDRYSDFLKEVQLHFMHATSVSPLFTTDAAGLWEAYLDAAPPGAERQVRTCNACRSFIERFGGLVSISPSGDIAPAMWPEAPSAYARASSSMRTIVKRAKVTGVFLSSEDPWGHPTTGPWSHIAVIPPTAIVYPRGKILTPGQVMAEKAEDYKMLQRGLRDFSIDTVRRAHSLLTNDSLYRSEKCVGVAKWLLDLHEGLDGAKKNMRTKAAIAWLAVAKAPPGYCHVRSSMIGTLLEDIAAELPFETIKRKFNEKMNPLQYMRPTAAPTAGNILQAERIVAALRSEGALDRRFAKLDDIQALWLPRAPRPLAAKGGTFGHLAPKPPTASSIQSSAPATVMTWAKFSTTILPAAEEIEYLVPAGRRENYTAMVTAANPDAPNLLQWDNPVSHYVYASGSLPSVWNLTPGFCRVTAVSLRSWMWGDKPMPHHGEGVVFVLHRAKDVNHARGGGMFPESMKSEYHAVRRTLEAHFNGAAIEGKDEAEACGIALTKGQPWNATFRVLVRGVRTLYKLDRWD